MSTKELIPSLDSTGWMSDNMLSLDKLFSHWLVANSLQSHLYRGRVSSFPKLIQEYSPDWRELEKQTQAQLTTYLGRYFAETDVSVYVRDDPNIEGGILIVNDVAVVDDQGVSTTLSRSITIKDSKTIRVYDNLG